MEYKAITLRGTGVVMTDAEGRTLESCGFYPDRQDPKVKPAQATGKMELMRDGTLFFTAFPPRIRNNSMLICKAAHGRLSGTRDYAVQLTLKAFLVEGIDWQRAFVTETVGIMKNLMGRERMSEILTKMIKDLEEHD